MEIVTIWIEKDIISQKIVNRGSTEDINNFLQVSNKFFKNKK